MNRSFCVFFIFLILNAKTGGCEYCASYQLLTSASLATFSICTFQYSVLRSAALLERTEIYKCKADWDIKRGMAF